MALNRLRRFEPHYFRDELVKNLKKAESRCVDFDNDKDGDA